MTTYTFTTPIAVGSLSSQRTISSLRLTGVNYTSTPALAQIGTGTLTITLTDPQSGWQEQISYQDASVLTLWSEAQSPAANTALGDIVAGAVFAKLIADGKLPAGTMSASVTTNSSTSVSGATGSTGTSSATTTTVGN